MDATSSQVPGKRTRLQEVIENIKKYKSSKGMNISDEKLSQRMNISADELQNYLKGDAEVPDHLPDLLLSAYEIRNVLLTQIIQRQPGPPPEWMENDNGNC